MARKADRRHLLDTSAVIYRLHGHTLQQAAVGEATAGGTVEVPIFVRMEYLRSVVFNLIEMHSLIKAKTALPRGSARGHARPTGLPTHPGPLFNLTREPLPVE